MNLEDQDLLVRYQALKRLGTKDKELFGGQKLGEVLLIDAQERNLRLSPEREELYLQLRERIGHTPLERYSGPIPNENEIFIKDETTNPFGSHYDRVYLDLFYYKELLSLIKPGDKVLETSSGSAGVSFAGIGRVLGYECHAAIPAGGEKAREEAIREQGAILYFTEAEQYINGFAGFLKSFLKQNPGIVYMNHSMGNILGYGKGVNNVATNSISAIYDEAVSQHGKPFDGIVSALGNGTNTLGLGRAARRRDPTTRLYAYEMFSSGAGYAQRYPGTFDGRFSVNPRDFSRHQMPGTSFPTDFNLPALLEATGAHVDEVMLVADQKTKDEYAEMTGKEALPAEVTQYDEAFLDPQIEQYGRSTRAGMAVALKLASTSLNKKTLLVLAYDKAERYDR